MKKVLIIFFLSTCTAVHKSTTVDYLLLSAKPTTLSKDSLRSILGVEHYYTEAPDDILVSKTQVYSSPSGWRETLLLYHQEGSGRRWTLLQMFPREGDYPEIQKVQKPRSDSLVLWLVLCKDLVVTRSYVLRNGTWTPL